MFFFPLSNAIMIAREAGAMVWPAVLLDACFMPKICGSKRRVETHGFVLHCTMKAKVAESRAWIGWVGD